MKSAKLTKLTNQLKKYEAGEIALTKIQLDKLYEDKLEETKKIKQLCKHNNCEVYESVWTDKGYGLDRHYTDYAIKCNDCDEHLMTGCESKGLKYVKWIDGEFKFFKPKRTGTIKELAKVWLNCFSKEDWEKNGVRINIKVSREVQIL